MESTIFCPFCGKKIAQGNAFCPFCGKELKAASAIDPTKVLAEQSAETENKLIPICKGLVFAGIFSEAIYLFESMANPLPFFFFFFAVGFLVGTIRPKLNEKTLQLVLYSLTLASFAVGLIMIILYKILALEDGTISTVLNLVKQITGELSLGCGLAILFSEKSKGKTSRIGLLAFAGFFLVIEVIALVYSETFSWIYLKTDLTFTRLNMIYSIIRGLLVDIPLIVASAGVILLTRKSFKAHEKRELSFSKNWNIVGVSTVLWLIVGYLFAAAPSFLTEGNIKYIYGYYKYDSEPYQYRLSFWIAFGLAVIASTLMLFALRRSTEELSKGFGLFSSGLFVQALGMFLIRWTINDFSWLHVALVGLGFGISLTGMAVLLVRIIDFRGN